MTAGIQKELRWASPYGIEESMVNICVQEMGDLCPRLLVGESWQLLNPPPEKNFGKNERLNFMGNTVHELLFLALPYAMIGVVGYWERIMRFLPHD